MKKVIVLGASRLQVPLIKECKDMGLYTVVLDYDNNALGKDLGDEFHLISIIDEQEVYEFAKTIQPDAILTTATDYPMRTVAYVSEKLGLNSISYDSAISATDKNIMAKKFDEFNLSAPKYLKIGNEQIININEIVRNQQLDFPLIVKPSDSAGSRGVTKVNDESSLKLSCERALKYSKSNHVIVEEFIEGEEVSVEILIENNNPQVIEITDKITTGSPNFIEVAHFEPSSLSESVKDKICELAINSCKALNLNTGAAHVEIKIDKGVPYLIETGPRLGGEFITSHLVPLATKINMLKNYILISLNEKIRNNYSWDGFYYSIFFIPITRSGIYYGISNWNEVNEKYNSYIVESILYYQSGIKVEQDLSSHDRLGYIITKCKSREESNHIFKDIYNNLDINIQ